jgi:GNAT superfamily N-acetyltransferase
MSTDTHIEIRTINADALPDIIKLYRVLRPDWVPPSTTAQQLDKYPAYGAYTADNDMAGFIYGNYFAPDILELYNIYICDALRGKSVGSRLLQAFEEDTGLRDYNAVLLFNSDAYETAQEKISAAPFYLKHGYQNIATTPQTKIFFKSLTV